MKMKNHFYVYVFFDPDGIPFYVGKGNNSRWKDHERDALNGKRGPVKNKIASLLSKNLKYVPLFQRGLTEQEAFELEIFLIESIGRRNIKTGPLLNLTVGGDGVSGYKWTDEDRQRQSRISKELHIAGKFTYDHLIGVPRSEKTKRKIQAALAGVKHSDARRKNISEKTKEAMQRFCKAWVVTTPSSSFEVESLEKLKEMGLASIYGSYRSGKPISRGRFKGYSLSVKA